MIEQVNIGLPADIYAFGIVMWEVLTRRTAWHWLSGPSSAWAIMLQVNTKARPKVQTARNICNRSLCSATAQICRSTEVIRGLPQVPPGLDQSARWMIRMCLHQNPSRRPKIGPLKDWIEKKVAAEVRLRSKCVCFTLPCTLLSTLALSVHVHDRAAMAWGWLQKPVRTSSSSSSSGTVRVVEAPPDTSNHATVLVPGILTFPDTEEVDPLVSLGWCSHCLPSPFPSDACTDLSDWMRPQVPIPGCKFKLERVGSKNNDNKDELKITKLLTSTTINPLEDEAHWLFEQTDMDDSGTLDKEELRQLLSDAGSTVDEVTLAMEFAKMDKSQDGQVAFADFREWCVMGALQEGILCQFENGFRVYGSGCDHDVRCN